MEFINTPARQSSRAENEYRHLKAALARSAMQLARELERRYPRSERVERYKADIEKFKGLLAA